MNEFILTTLLENSAGTFYSRTQTGDINIRDRYFLYLLLPKKNMLMK